LLRLQWRVYRHRQCIRQSPVKVFEFSWSAWYSVFP
jgi:hypothetical protein